MCGSNFYETDATFIYFPYQLRNNPMSGPWEHVKCTITLFLFFTLNEFTFQEKIKQEFGIECYMPANGETATIKTPITIAASVSANLLRDEARRFDTR